MRAKTVRISNRMMPELERLWNESSKNLDDLVFGQKDIKRAFDGARKDAGVPNCRIHDLRHLFGSRVAKKNANAFEIARLLGHKTVQMSYRYVNADAETRERAKSIIDEFHAETDTSAKAVSEAVN